MSPKKKSVAEWSAAQVASRLSEHELVLTTNVISPGRVYIERIALSPILVATTAVEHVNKESVQNLLLDPTPDFIVNIPKESFVDGEALALLKQAEVPISQEAELFKILDEDEIKTYKNKHVGWIEQALLQDNFLEMVEQLYDRVFLVKRKDLAELKIVFLFEYELTAAKLRTAKRWYKEFDIVVISNPCGSPTLDAEKVALSIGCRIIKWYDIFEEFDFISNPINSNSAVQSQKIENYVVSKIQKKASYLAKLVGNLQWYLFGSSLTGVKRPQDIDILVVYPEEEDTERLKKLLANFLLSAPVDLILMSQAEEQQTNFVQSQNCQRFYPP